MIGGGSATGLPRCSTPMHTVKDDGTARTLGKPDLRNEQPTFTATVAGGLIVNDFAGIPASPAVFARRP
jgi:hypothetical protein